jgi:GAF domain-containing protein
MADQVAVAINNALTFSQEVAILEATSPLYRASRHIALATNLNGVLKSIVDYAAGSYVDRCSFNLYMAGMAGSEADWVEIAALWDRANEPPHPVGTRYPIQPSSLAEHLRREAAEPLVVDDLLAEEIDPRIGDETHSILAETLQLRAVLMLPLAVAGQPPGVLLVASRQPHAWTEAEVRTFRALCDHAAVVVQNIRLLEETQAQSTREQVIRRISEQMWRAADVESILQRTVTHLSQALGAPRVYARLGTQIESEAGNGNRSASSPTVSGDSA